MVLPPPSALPVHLRDGWPDAFSGCVIGTRDASILFGEVSLAEDEWTAVAAGPASSLRIDEHEVTDSWSTTTGRWIFRRVTSRSCVIPVEPVSVPPEALTGDFGGWVRETHGSGGRLLVWSDDRTWWFVHDPQLEFVVTCGPPGMFMDVRERTSMWDVATPAGMAAIEGLRERYGFDWDTDSD